MTTDARDTSLLAHLAFKFTSEIERFATEALGYILSRSAGARRALQGMLKDRGVDVGTIAQVQTECEIRVKEKNARADLVGFDTTRAKRTIVECKFEAGLTEQQPNTYIEKLLKNEEPSVLLFVVPESRLEALWPEILRLAAGGGFALNEVDAATGTDWRSAVVNNGNHRLMLTSWRTLLKEMSGKAGDPTVENDVRQLQSLCDQQDRDAFLPLHEGELGRGFSRRAMDLYRLYDGVILRLTEEGIVDGKGKAGNWGANYGRHTWFGRPAAGHALREKVWIGIGFEYVKYRETPFWVLFESGDQHLGRIREKLDAAPKGTFDVIHTANETLIPIYLRTGVEYAAVLDAAVEDIRKISDWLGTAA